MKSISVDDIISIVVSDGIIDHVPMTGVPFSSFCLRKLFFKHVFFEILEIGQT